MALPLVIAHQISLYFATCKRRGQLESVGPAGYNNLVQSINALVECFTTCERIVTVEIPNVYTIHLKRKSLVGMKANLDPLLTPFRVARGRHYLSLDAATGPR